MLLILDIEKKEPKIFEEEPTEKEVKNLEPLILTDEVKEKKVSPITKIGKHFLQLLGKL